MITNCRQHALISGCGRPGHRPWRAMTGQDGPHWLPARLLQDVQMSGRHSPVPVRPKNGFCTHPVSRNFTMARIQLVFPQHLQAKHHMLIYLVTSSPPLLLQIQPMSSLCRSYHSGRQYFNITSYHVFPQIQQCWVNLKNRTFRVLWLLI